MTEKELLLAYLGVTLNLSPERIAESLYKKSDDGILTDEIQEGAIDALKSLDKERITKIKPDTKEFFNNGYKAAESKISERYEKMIRDKTGVEDATLQGEELLLAGLEKVAKPKLDEDKVKTHPWVLAREKELLALAETYKLEGANALEEFKGQQTKMQRVQSAQNKAKDILLSMKPVLEAEQRVADRRIKNFLNEFAGFDYEEVDGELIPIKDGKRLENEQFHPVSFEKLVKDLAAENFLFQVQDAKGNGGNQNQDQQQRAAPVGKYATQKDFEDAYYKETDQAVKTKMAEEHYGSVLK